MTTARTDLHSLVDALSEQDVENARQVLTELVSSANDALSVEEESGIAAALESARAGRVVSGETVFDEARRLLTSRGR